MAAKFFARVRGLAVRALFAAALTGCAAGCAGLTVPEKLGRVGLALLSEEEAGVPAAERGKFVPCRTIPEFPGPALPPHPAGYFLVTVGEERGAEGAKAVLEAIEAWRPGETLVFRVRRNPYLDLSAEWWEAEVKMKLP